MKIRNYLLLNCPHFMADDGGGAGGAGDGGQGGGTATYTPPATQEELDKMFNERLARRDKQYGMTPDEAKKYKDRTEALENDLASETQQAVKKAKDEATASERSKGTTRAVRAEFRAAGKGVLESEQLDALLEDLDLSKYADDDGDPDVDKIEAKVKKFAPKGPGKGGDQKPAPRTLGQGDRPAAGEKAGDRGRAMAEKRFGKKQ